MKKMSPQLENLLNIFVIDRNEVVTIRKGMNAKKADTFKMLKDYRIDDTLTLEEFTREKDFLLESIYGIIIEIKPESLMLTKMRIASIFFSSVCIIFFIFSGLKSYSSDFFNLNGKQFEINEMDIGSTMGCIPGRLISVVIRKSSDQEVVWSYLTKEEIKKYYFHKNKCHVATNHSRVEKVFSLSDDGYVDFVITHLQCGASCVPQTATIMRFDGNKVGEVKMIAEGDGLKLDIDINQKKIVAIHQIEGGECNACAKRWAKVTYKWDGKNYKKIEKIVSKEKSNTSPWSVSELPHTANKMPPDKPKLDKSKEQSKKKVNKSESDEKIPWHLKNDKIKEVESLMKAKLRIVCDRFYPYENNCTTKQTESFLWIVDLVNGALPDADKYSGTRFQLCMYQFYFGGELFDYIGIKECTITEEVISRPDEDVVKGFVTNFLRETNQGKIENLLNYYDDRVDFYGKTYTINEIRRDKENYYRRWTSVSAERSGDITIKEKGSNRIELVFPIKFVVENPEKNKAISGSAINTLVLKKIDGKLKIILEDQKITERREYAPKPLASKPQVQKEEMQVHPKVQLKEQVGAGSEQRFKASVNTYVKWLKEQQPDTTESQKAYLCRHIESDSSLSDKQKVALKKACEIAGFQTKTSAIPLKQTDPWGEVTW